MVQPYSVMWKIPSHSSLTNVRQRLHSFPLPVFVLLAMIEKHCVSLVEGYCLVFSLSSSSSLSVAVNCSDLFLGFLALYQSPMMMIQHMMMPINRRRNKPTRRIRLVVPWRLNDLAVCCYFCESATSLFLLWRSWLKISRIWMEEIKVTVLNTS